MRNILRIFCNPVFKKTFYLQRICDGKPPNKKEGLLLMRKLPKENHCSAS